MRRNHDSKIKVLLIVIGIALLLSYMLFNFRIFIKGPQIDSIEPQNGSSFSEPFIIVRGKAKNISYISLNDTPIFVDEKGNFGQKLLLSPGLSIIKLYARDKFEREVTKTLEYVYTGNETEINIEDIADAIIETSTTTDATTTPQEEL